MNDYLKEKRYAHFDKRLSKKKAINLLSDEGNISNHGFLPFIHYVKINRRIEKINEKIREKEAKKRDIYYASHFDRYIYQHYAHIIGDEYNRYLKEKNISDVSVAYRTDLGKCNIDFAKDMFDFIKSASNAYIMVGDFTGFFDNLEHIYLKRMIKKVLYPKQIDKNMYKMFKSVCHFSYIEMEDIYKQLSIIKNKRIGHYYLRKQNQIMSLKDFKKYMTTYIKHNPNIDYGIIQGSPISGLFANIYMIEFDKNIKELVEKYNGKYLRYSDDFMIILPKIDLDKFQLLKKEIFSIQESIPRLQLQLDKTKDYYFNDKKIFVFNDGNLKKDILNFLGFSFDGKSVNIRDKTISKYNNKLHRKIKKYKQGKDVTIKDIFIRFSYQGDSIKGKGNFISYVRRSEKIFISESNISKVRKNSKKRIINSLNRKEKKKNLTASKS